MDAGISVIVLSLVVPLSGFMPGNIITAQMPALKVIEQPEEFARDTSTLIR